MDFKTQIAKASELREKLNNLQNDIDEDVRWNAKYIGVRFYQELVLAGREHNQFIVSPINIGRNHFAREVAYPASLDDPIAISSISYRFTLDPFLHLEIPIKHPAYRYRLEQERIALMLFTVANQMGKPALKLAQTWENIEDVSLEEIEKVFNDIGMFGYYRAFAHGLMLVSSKDELSIDELYEDHMATDIDKIQMQNFYKQGKHHQIRFDNMVAEAYGKPSPLFPYGEATISLNFDTPSQTLQLRIVDPTYFGSSPVIHVQEDPEINSDEIEASLKGIIARYMDAVLEKQYAENRTYSPK